MPEEILKLRALVVEDERCQNHITATLLMKAGFMVTRTFSGNEAINCIEKGFFHLAVIDLGLPDINGIELVSMLRSEPSGVNTHVIIYSGADDMALEEALDAGADEVYQKPVKNTIFLSRIYRIAARLSSSLKTEYRLALLEQRMDVSIKLTAETMAASSLRIDQMEQILSKISGEIEKVSEIVSAWDHTKAMFNGLHATATFVKYTWPLWLAIAAIVAFIKNGKWDP